MKKQWYDNIVIDNADKYATAEESEYTEKPKKKKLVFADSTIFKKDGLFSPTGLAIGALSGALMALLLKKNVYLFTFLGAGIGSLGKGIFTQKKTDYKLNNKTNENGKSNI